MKQLYTRIAVGLILPLCILLVALVYGLAPLPALAQINTLQASITALQNGGSTQARSASSGGTCPTFTRTLSRGSTGSDVVQLQQYLISLGLLAAGNDTGYFGPLTEAAVAQWQSAHGIESVGIVGPLTRAAVAQCK